MLKRIGSVLTLAFLITGCGKSKESQPATPPAGKGPQVSVESLLDKPAAAPQPPPEQPAEAPAPPTPAVPPPPPDESAAAGTTPSLMTSSQAKLPPELISLKKLMDKHFEITGSFPNGWQEMINAKLIKSVPVGKDGKPLDWVTFVQTVTK
jgi:type IV secretory pathway VirB10-like protein